MRPHRLTFHVLRDLSCYSGRITVTLTVTVTITLTNPNQLQSVTVTFSVCGRPAGQTNVPIPATTQNGYPA